MAIRARQLTSPKIREKLAAAIDRLLRTAEASSKFSVGVAPEEDAISAARAHLQLISEILAGQDLVYAHGVALTIALLRDPDSPLYLPSETGSAWYWAQLAIQALEGNL